MLEYAAYVENYSTHPISVSLKAAYGKDIDPGRVAKVEEIVGHGVSAEVDGIKVYAGNAKLMDRIGINIQAVNTLPGTVVHVAVGGTYAGFIPIADEVKEHSASALGELKALGVVSTAMLTGDVQTVADAVARQVGVDAVHAGLLPGDKVAIVEELMRAKAPGDKLALVGDGINDAPVLARADLGIAMGGLGSDAAIEAADIVLMTDEPEKLPSGIKIARKTVAIVWQNTVLAISVKLLVLALSAAGLAGMWAAVFSDIAVTTIAVLNAMRTLQVKNV